MKFSEFGERYTRNSGILSVMDDLGRALSSQSETIMMGGGNPSIIPEVQAVFKQRLRDIADDDASFNRMVSIYDPPQGNLEFIRQLAHMLNQYCGWSLTERNITLTNGSQASFFALFNLLGGRFNDGSFKNIHFPLCPEYIGYADLGLQPGLFSATQPDIDSKTPNRFKYRINFERLNKDLRHGNIGACCLSRPTNPSGNVISDTELAELIATTRQHQTPLILDCAYGKPFPNLIFTDASMPALEDHMIVSMSLSKLGLPASRTGIIIASEEIIEALSRVNAIINLATGGFGSMMAMELVKSGDIVELSNEIIRPYYQQRQQQAIKQLESSLEGIDYALHEPEGAMFLWLWLKDCPVDNLTLYQRLKDRGVLIISGHYFFPGLADDWQHTRECLRITYTQEPDQVEKGFGIIGEEIRRAYKEVSHQDPNRVV